MIASNPSKAKAVAAWFADFSRFKPHGRPVSLEDARAQGLNVTMLEDDQTLQDLVLSVRNAVHHTFNDTGTTKLIENHHGRAYLEMTGQVLLQQAPPVVAPPNPGQGQGNRQQRREKERHAKQRGG